MPRVHCAALNLFGLLVREVEPDQWGLPTPCRLWNVGDLVNHVAVQEQWLALLLSGAPAAAVGDRLDGDQLGDDPVLSFKRAATEAKEAIQATETLDSTVTLWSGPAPARDLVSQLTMDLVVHSWDLARAIGTDEGLPALLVAFALWEVSDYADRLTGSGLFDPPLPVPEGPGWQTRLLALTGRQAGTPFTGTRTEPVR
ncbi:TIGR03086 family metal-binding protein [Streptacidiphilus pinicola]|uniref:TIGR03086 family metal-binding protein n=1 Tax=Streptacidiphilus pinicola TaxID=2219663 RepID=UPI001FB5469E|nr:TIGR03086 family metal-binding protein [Streptacidiphilus pinicola]